MAHDPIMPDDPGIAPLLDNNRRWAAKISARDPGFFKTLATQQRPKWLWIGCSDSRVPANEIAGLLPGEVFVHRNVANVVVHSDLNCLSVLQYGIDALQVRHIIVCGHLGCGGVMAAMQGLRVGLADNWICHVRDVYARWRHRFPEGLNDAARAGLLSALNVVEQVVNVCRTTVVGDAWARGQHLSVHGLIYGLHDGILHEVVSSIQSSWHIDAECSAAAERLLAEGLADAIRPLQPDLANPS